MVKHPNTQHTVLQCPEQHSTSVSRDSTHPETQNSMFPVGLQYPVMVPSVMLTVT